MLSRREALKLGTAAATAAVLPAIPAAPAAPVVAAAKAAPLPTWIVGTPGEWDHEVIRAATYADAVRFRADECEDDGSDPDCDCGCCVSARGYEATRVEEWDGRSLGSISDADWVAAGFQAICDRCGDEADKDAGGAVVQGKAVCGCCMTLADWRIIDPEYAAEMEDCQPSPSPALGKAETP